MYDAFAEPFSVPDENLVDRREPFVIEVIVYLVLVCSVELLYIGGKKIVTAGVQAFQVTIQDLRRQLIVQSGLFVMEGAEDVGDKLGGTGMGRGGQ